MAKTETESTDKVTGPGGVNVWVHWDRASVWEDENVLAVDSGDGCIAM